MNLLPLTALLVTTLASTAFAAPEFGAVDSEGTYPKHLQGICTDGRETIFWSWTDVLVKTDLAGKVLKEVPAASHHGDLCYHDGRVYVAVNLGKFNRPAGAADSWVFVYEAETLSELARYPVQDVVHGAGGMAYRDGRFYVVGGLPLGVNENYVYEYDEKFQLKKRHIVASGETLKGIQTVAYADGSWWFGCYGKPAVLLRADEDFRFNGKWEFNAALGIAPIPSGKFLIGKNTLTKDVGYRGRVEVARPDPDKGMVLDGAASEGQ